MENPEDWKWSSFVHYATGMEGIVEIESQWTARRREQMGVVLVARAHPPAKNAGRVGQPHREFGFERMGQPSRNKNFGF